MEDYKEIEKISKKREKAGKIAIIICIISLILAIIFFKTLTGNVVILFSSTRIAGIEINNFFGLIFLAISIISGYFYVRLKKQNK